MMSIKCIPSVFGIAVLTCILQFSPFQMEANLITLRLGIHEVPSFLFSEVEVFDMASN